MPALIDGPEGTSPRHANQPLLPAGMSPYDAVVAISHVAYATNVRVPEKTLQWAVPARSPDYGPCLFNAVSRPWTPDLAPVGTRGNMGPDVPTVNALKQLMLALELKAMQTQSNVNRRGEALAVYTNPTEWCDLDPAADYRLFLLTVDLRPDADFGLPAGAFRRQMWDLAFTSPDLTALAVVLRAQALDTADAWDAARQALEHVPLPAAHMAWC
jgi:hypothetical protein